MFVIKRQKEAKTFAFITMLHMFKMWFVTHIKLCLNKSEIKDCLYFHSTTCFSKLHFIFGWILWQLFKLFLDALI